VRGTAKTSCHIELGSFKLEARSVLCRLKERIAEFYRMAGVDQPDLDLGSIRDNVAARESVFEQSSALLDPLVEDLWSHICRLPRKELQRCLKIEQLILEALACAFCLFSGITPRSFQAVTLRYSATNSHRRNLFHLQGLPVISCPLEKHWSRTHQASLWALPQECAPSLYTLLGIIRPVVIQIVSRLQGGHSPHLLTHIFAGAGPRSMNQVWRSTKFARMVADGCSASPQLACPLFPNYLRHIITAIFDFQFPSLIRSSPWYREMGRGNHETSRSVANASAGHSDWVQGKNYGQSHTAQAMGIPDADIHDFIRVSRTWHAVISMGPAEDEMRESLIRLETCDFKERTHMAFDVARALVCQSYGMGGGLSSDEIRKLVQKALRNKKFISTTEVSDKKQSFASPVSYLLTPSFMSSSVLKEWNIWRQGIGPGHCEITVWLRGACPT